MMAGNILINRFINSYRLFCFNRTWTNSQALTKSRVLAVCFLVLGALFSSAVFADSLTVTADRQRIQLNETLNLSIRFDGRQVDIDPDLSGLDQFDILSNHKSTQHSVINGVISVRTEWKLTLSPRNTGQLLIPPISMHGQHSQALTIVVTEASKDPISGKEDVFLELFSDKSEAFVQEQFIVTFRLHFNQHIDGLEPSQFNIPNVRIEQLPRVDYQTTIGHTTYGVAEFRYAIYPDASGPIEIPSQTWTIRTTDQPGMSRFGFGGGRYRLHRVRTDPITVTIHPKPSAFPANAPWLPANQVTLSEQWSRPTEQFRVGEPITRTIIISADGVTPEQLPPILDERGTASLKFYPDKPEQTKQPSAQGIKSTRTESVAIVPSHSGEIELPEVSVTWWNTEKKQVEKATLPARTLLVAPAEGTQMPPASPPATSAQQSNPMGGLDQEQASKPQASSVWMWLCALLALTNVMTLVVLWQRAQTSFQQSASSKKDLGNHHIATAKHAIQKACAAKDPTQARLALLNWAQHVWPNERILLAHIGSKTGSAELSKELLNLEANLFAGGEHKIQYDVIWKAIHAYSVAKPTSNNSALPGLYPTN